MLAIRTGNRIAAEYMNFLSRRKSLSGLRHRDHVIEIAAELLSTGSAPDGAPWRPGRSGRARSRIGHWRFARQSGGIGPWLRPSGTRRGRAADPRFRFRSMDWPSGPGQAGRRPQVAGRAATESAVNLY